MNKEVRKSKIYSYFHGAGNVFQQFIVVLGILCIILTPVASRARDIKSENTHEKYLELNETAKELKSVYNDLYIDYSKSERYNFNCDLYEEAKIVENDKNSEEKKAYNNALKAYNDAVANLEKAKENSNSVKLQKEAAKLKEICEDIYYDNYYRFYFSLFEEAKINTYDSYRNEKTQYNNALKAYKAAEEKAALAAEEEKNSNEYAEFEAAIEKCKIEYENLHKKYCGAEGYNFICKQYEEAVIAESDKYSEEKKAHNEALEDYNKAQEKADKKLEKYNNLSSSASLSEIVLPIIGAIAVIVGIIWSIIKRFSFDKKSCEQAYDEELQEKIEEAKVKALEKLNIVAEQIEKVEPVVLNGIATYDAGTGKNSIGKIAALSQGFADFFASVKVILIGAVAAALYAAVSLIFGSAFFIPVIGAIILAAYTGFKVYTKYEKESYVNPKLIQNLEKLNPSLAVRLGTDDNIRVSLPAITVYMFGNEQIYMYYQYLDIVTGKIFCEGIHEYFYEDIVGVVSTQETKKMFKRTGFFKFSVRIIEYLKESITVVSSGCKHSETYIVPMGSSLLDTSFVGMRNLIRQKKSDNE